MGSRGAFLPQGGFSEPLKYQEIGKIEGVKVLGKKNSASNNLPERANAAAYIAYDQNGRPKQSRVFEKRFPALDIDFGHSRHHGLTKEDFQFTNTRTALEVTFRGSLRRRNGRVGGKLSRKFRRSDDEKKRLWTRLSNGIMRMEDG